MDREQIRAGKAINEWKVPAHPILTMNALRIGVEKILVWVVFADPPGIVAKDADWLGHRISSKSSLTSVNRNFVPAGKCSKSMCLVPIAIRSRRLSSCSAW